MCQAQQAYALRAHGPISDNIKFFVSVESRGTDDLNPSSHPSYTMDRTEFSPLDTSINYGYGLLLDDNGYAVKDEFENVTVVDLSGSPHAFVDAEDVACNEGDEGCSANPNFNSSYGMAPEGFDGDGDFFSYYRHVSDIVQDSMGVWVEVADTIYSGYNNLQTNYGTKANSGGTRTTVSGNISFDFSPLLI